MSTTLSPSGLVAPAMTDKVPDTIAALAANFQLLNDYLHPVGSIAYFTTSFDPNAHWGGTWVEDTSGRTDVASSAAHPAGSTWGSETHQITINEMPPHKHPSTTPNLLQNHVTDTGGTAYGFITDGSWTDSGSDGGGQAMSLAQPSTAVHKWVRTA